MGLSLMSIPNAFTWIRIGLVPVFVMVFYLPYDLSHVFAALIFAFAALTDWLDGYLARYLRQSSAFGAFLDPVADKLIVTTALVLLVAKYHFIAIPAAVIVGREIVISALREWMAELGKRASVAVTFIAKTKTVIQMLAVVVLVAYGLRMPNLILTFGYALLYLAAGLTIWTMVMYLRAAWPSIQVDVQS